MRGVDLEAVEAFKKRHRKKHGPDRSVSGGRFSYIFTPTAIGVAVTVECACGDSADCTDYESW